MPKIFNTSWLAVLLATIAFFMLGFIWYAFIFDDIWQAASGITDGEAAASMETDGVAIYISAVLMTLGQAIGILWVIHLAGAKTLAGCLKIGFWAAVTFGSTILAYDVVWGNYPLSGYLVDLGHVMVGYCLMAGIYALFRRKL